MKIKLSFVMLIASLIFLLFPLPVRADGIIIPDPPPGPIPGPIPISQLIIRYHRVDVNIENQIAVTQVDQVFYNPNDWVVEGEYIFPIPAGASVSAFQLWIDGEPVEGEIMDAEEARGTYEEIVREMQDPALLEYADQGALRARIFPIPPGGERRIELEYSEVLSSEKALVHYIYPLNTEKFSTEPLEQVSINVDLRSDVPIRAVYSSSHSVAIDRHNEYHLSIGYEESQVTPDTDFNIFYSLGEEQAFHILSYREPRGEVDPDGFFLLLLAPRPDAVEENIPKDVILVLDRSGSMEGEKFRQAQTALSYILEHLNDDDRFNIITFSTGVETYATQLRSVSEVSEAIAWVGATSAAGSTDINRALLEAASFIDQDRPTYLIFLTDGLPTEGVTDSQMIINNLIESAPSNLRLFAFGVGYDVDTYLLDSLAKDHHGTSIYVIPGEQLDEVLSSFYEKISSPVLTDLELSFEDIVVYDVYPSPLPDLFAGSQIIVVGRYLEGGLTSVTLEGVIDGETNTFVYHDQNLIEISNQSGPETSIPRLWATRKIGHLLNNIRLEGPDQETIDQIVRLSIRYGVVTPYTSYLVTDPMPLGADEQDRIAREQFTEMEAQPDSPSYGREAVEMAAGEGELKDADAATTPSEQISNVIRIVGSRTFIFNNKIWVDTAYDPEMDTVRVAFLSDDYFNLVNKHPDLANAFALGSQVIAMDKGIAYKVVSRDIQVEPLDMLPTESPSDKPAPVELEPTLTGQTPTPDENEGLPPAPGTMPCIGGLMVILLPSIYLAVVRSERSFT
ncbi:MAG: VIT domain-containing protein [Anaerolineales bacterium]|jgi:Ca-activated chloride channel family protein